MRRSLKLWSPLTRADLRLCSELSVAVTPQGAVAGVTLRGAAVGSAALMEMQALGRRVGVGVQKALAAFLIAAESRSSAPIAE